MLTFANLRITFVTSSIILHVITEDVSQQHAQRQQQRGQRAELAAHLRARHLEKTGEIDDDGV